MKRLFVVMVCMVWIGSVSAFQPRTGNWWNPSESGRDFGIEVQNGILVLVVYVYQAGGPPQWYLSSGPTTNLGRSYTGTLDKYVNGQCISCPYTGAPTHVGNDGTITINFSSEIAATVMLPGGQITHIQPFNFSGEPPQGLLGEWLFVYDNISTFAVKFNLTTILNPTPGGNGIAAGSVVGASSHAAGCELQTSGLLAGTIVCAEIDSTGAVLNGYTFQFGVNQAYGGNHLTADGKTLHPMTGYKSKSRSEVTGLGLTSRALATMAAAPVAGGQTEEVVSVDHTGYLDAAIRERSKSIIDLVSRASNLR